MKNKQFTSRALSLAIALMIVLSLGAALAEIEEPKEKNEIFRGTLWDRIHRGENWTPPPRYGYDREGNMIPLPDLDDPFIRKVWEARMAAQGVNITEEEPDEEMLITRYPPQSGTSSGTSGNAYFPSGSPGGYFSEEEPDEEMLITRYPPQSGSSSGTSGNAYFPSGSPGGYFSEEEPDEEMLTLPRGPLSGPGGGDAYPQNPYRQTAEESGDDETAGFLDGLYTRRDEYRKAKAAVQDELDDLFSGLAGAFEEPDN